MNSTCTEVDSFSPIEVRADARWAAQTEHSIGALAMPARCWVRADSPAAR